MVHAVRRGGQAQDPAGERAQALQAGLMADELLYRIEIDRDTCMGSGVCTVYASNTFDLDEDTKFTVIDPAGDPLEQIEAAASGCPTGAIKVVRLPPPEWV